MSESGHPETLLERAVGAVERGNGYRAELDRIPVPVYTTDADGLITYWNRACAAFAGREPQLGQDRWCVTWRLFTLEGLLLPHDECPMARAIKERRSIRSEIAIAMRPDGSRVAFRPYPTPIFDNLGELKGAINMLVDISDEQAEALKEQAARCRRLANSTDDMAARDILRTMANGYEQSADSLRHS
jgi:PAS domain S-box-containing protein